MDTEADNETIASHLATGAERLYTCQRLTTVASGRFIHVQKYIIEDPVSEKPLVWWMKSIQSVGANSVASDTTTSTLGCVTNNFGM